jgi:glycosyltransferase involved in cell wall biosynthesis
MPTVSVIVPVKDEAGTIHELVERMPQMGLWTEILFVESGSTDDTWSRIAAEEMAHPTRVWAVTCPTRGKADAVRMGFNVAHGDVLAILDGDLSIASEDLPKFLDKVKPGVLVIGSRMLEMNPADNTMRLLNLLGNRFFARLVSFICRQRVSDSLCGTKVLMYEDWLRIKELPTLNDPYLDFTLLFGAAQLGMKIVNVPVQYHARTYGRSNIRRWRDGLKLLRVCLKAMWRLR